MAKKPGSRAQIWCHTPLTHWMCNGYRFELLGGEKVEGLCTCSCHEDDSGGIRGTNHMANVVDDSARYMAAKRVSSELDPEASADAEPSRLKVVAGPIRLPSKDANPIFLEAEASLSSGSDLIARRVANSFATWTEIWDSGSGHWLPVNAEDISPLEAGTPLTVEEAARVDDGVPREEP